jgi:predicted Fe-Mo cluster-binding NifX family protein
VKVAISAQGTERDSLVDPRFGRCRYFVVCDTETGETEAHDNDVNLNAVQGAGIQSAANVAALGVSAVLTGHVGPNAYRALSAAGLTVYSGVSGTVGEALEALKCGALEPASAADAEAHGGL